MVRCCRFRGVLLLGTGTRGRSIISTELRVEDTLHAEYDATLPTYSNEMYTTKDYSSGEEKGLRWSNEGRDEVERWMHQNRASLERKSKKRVRVNKKEKEGMQGRVIER